jgi:hypothetical protein
MTLKEALYLTPAKLLTVSVTIDPSPLKQEALIDGGSQLNLISALLVKEMGLKVTPLPKILAQGANGSKLTVYGTTTASVDVTDSRGRMQNHRIPFVVTDLH